ncbi:RdRP [Anopheles darlingi virus]|uniref:Replicase n=1 Tax=Anopheles darlingi virus TaxID=2546224 RepID=A0AAE5YGL5_9MONO|nr:RdRP [Anopheles darlingi virus]QBK47210.1 RdRP [Anopheles darlingi virus]
MSDELFACEDRILGEDPRDEFPPMREEAKTRRETACIPGHLSQPIYGAEVDMIYTGLDWACSRHKKLEKHCEGCGTFRDYPQIYDDVEQWLMGEHVDAISLESRIKVIMEGVKNYPLQRSAFCYSARNLVSSEIVFEWSKDKVRKFKELFYLIREDLRTMMKVEQFKDSVCFEEIPMGNMKYHRDGKFEREISIITIRGKKVLVPTTLVLCCADKLQSLFGLKLYWILSDLFDRYPGHSIFRTGCDLIYRFRSLRKTCVEGFFGFAASWEALIVGDTIAQSDDEGDTGLFANQIESMQVYLDDIKTSLTMMDFLPPRNCGISERRLWLELTGMTKIFGYPILREEMLLDQLREHGVNSHPDFSFPTLSHVMGLIKRDFIINYRAKTGKFPNIAYCPEKIKNYMDRDEIFPKWLTRDYDAWNSIVFSQTLDFDYSPDLSELTKDSACAVPLSQWPSMYDRCAYKYHYGKDMPRYDKKKCHTRVVMAFLEADEDKVRKLVRDIERMHLNPENRIIVQCGKELEQKEFSGRAFTKQTPEQRYLQVVMEMNIADNIFRFVPEQSMTDGEVALANRQMSQYRELGGRVDFMSMDLTKWCLRHRSVMVEEIGKMYDSLFGLNGLYQTSHDFFVHCNVFVNSRMCPPDYDDEGNPIPGPFFMNNFVGGCEGLHQKKWTHMTIGIIKLALERTGIKGTLMGQGDNQIVMLHYDSSQIENRTSIRSAFLAQCERLFNSVGHRLKRQETWYSSQLHEYGKLRMYKGVIVSQGTKKSTKLIPDINDGLFAISSSIATLNTLTEAIAKGNQDADVAFMMNQILLASYLHRKSIIQSSKASNVRALLMFPTDFGGISLSTFHSHSVRGHDDPVTLWLAIYKVVESLDHTLYSDIMRCVMLYPSSPAITSLDRTRLIEDPHCLRVATLPTANRKISEYCLQYLKSDNVTNPAIKRLYQTSVSMDYNKLIEILDKMEPLYASLANVILKNSNAGIGMLLQGKFTSIKTIEVASKRYGDVSLIELIQQTNNKFKSALRSRMFRANLSRNLDVFNSHACPTQLAEHMRKEHWNRNLVGVTKPPHIHQVVLIDHDKSTEEQKKRSVLVKLSSVVRSKNLSGCSKFGPYNGYVGSRTKVKVKPPSANIMEKTSYTKGLQTLGRTMTWMQLYNNVEIASLCQDLMNEKLVVLADSMKSDVLKDVHETVMSGNPFHRLMSQVESTTSSINGMITTTSHFSQSSNPMQNMSREGEDFSIFFQYVYSANIAVLSSLSSISDLPPVIDAVLECTTCTYELPEPRFDLDYKKPDPCSALQEYSLESRLNIISEDLSVPFAVAIGEEIAKNVDENYRLNHGHGSYNSPHKSIKLTKISINDFKRLDLLDIICSMIVHSRHCGTLISENHEAVLAESNDLSFSGLATLVLESNSRERLFEIVGSGVSQHTMVTQAERMSAFISSNIVKLFLDYRDHIEKQILPVEFKVSGDGWRFSVFSRLARMYNSHKIWYNRKSYRWGERRGSIGVIVSSFNIKLRKYPIEMHEVVQYWRPNPTRSPVIIDQEQSLVPVSQPSYPFADVDAFRHAMSSDFNMGHLSYNFLAFMARPIMNLSSAASKYIEILCMLNVIDEFKSSDLMIICLAEGSGGTLDRLLDAFPSATGTYNTLLEPECDNRQVATDCAPPAAVVTSNTARCRNYNLSSGETDITKAAFLEKLERCIRENIYKKTLLTMDAESMNRSDNINHIENLVPLVDKYHIRLSIIKVFLSPNLINFLESFMSRFPDLDWTLYKPISSNPISHEIFLLIQKKNTSDMMTICRENMRSDYQFLMTEAPKMTNRCLRSYILASASVYHMFKRMYSNEFSCLGDKWVPSKACGLICKVTLHSYIHTARLIESCSYLESVRVLIRGGGQPHTLHDYIQRIIFLGTFLSSNLKSTEMKLSQLSSVVIDKSTIEAQLKYNTGAWIVRANMLGGTYLSEWRDIKFFIRHIHDDPCKCIPELPTPIEDELPNSIVKRAFKNMEVLNLIEINEFFCLHDQIS